MAKNDITLEKDLEVAVESGTAPIQLPGKVLSIFPAFAHRNFQLYFAGQAISLLGFWLHQVAIGWLVFQLTHSSFWVGIVTSSLSKVKNKSVFIINGILIACTSLLIFSLNHNFKLAHLLLFLVGFGTLMQVSTLNTLVQLASPDVMRARIMAVYITMFVGMMPIGNATAGILAQKTSAPFTIGAGATIVLIIGTIIYLKGIFANFK